MPPDVTDLALELKPLRKNLELVRPMAASVHPAAEVSARLRIVIKENILNLERPLGIGNRTHNEDAVFIEGNAFVEADGVFLKEGAAEGAASDTAERAVFIERTAAIPATDVIHRIADERIEQLFMDLRASAQVEVPRRNEVADPEETQVGSRTLKKRCGLAEEVRAHRIIGIDEEDVVTGRSLESAIAGPGRTLRLVVVDDELLDLKPRRRLLQRLERSLELLAVPRVARDYYRQFHWSLS